jgi:hypothetical protein
MTVQSGATPKGLDLVSSCANLVNQCIEVASTIEHAPAGVHRLLLEDRLNSVV